MPSYSQRLLSTTAVLAVLWAGFASAQCYKPDGTAIVLADEGWFQCPTTADGHSQCCGKNEKCMPMGLCGEGGATIQDKSKGYWFREYCSDPTWGSPKCSNVCLQDGFNGAGTILTWCKNGSVCCGFESTDCCENGDGVFLDSNGRVIKDEPEPEPTTTKAAPKPTPVVSEKPKTTSSKEPEETSSSKAKTTSESTAKSTRSQVTVTKTAATTKQDGNTEAAEIKETIFTGAAVAVASAPADESDVSAASNQAPESKAGLSSGAAAGIGAGVGILGMCLLGGAFFLWKRNQKKKQQQQYHPADGLPAPAYLTHNPHAHAHQPTASEDAAYLGAYKPNTIAGPDQAAYSAKLATDSQVYRPIVPQSPAAELPHHYPQQYAHELPPHVHHAAHEMPGGHPPAHEMGVGSPPQGGFASELPVNAYRTTDGNPKPQ